MGGRTIEVRVGASERRIQMKEWIHEKEGLCRSQARGVEISAFVEITGIMKGVKCREEAIAGGLCLV